MEFICLRTFLRVARVEKVRSEHMILIGKPEVKGRFGDLGMDGRIVLKQL